jgi:hypothetical protein
MIFNSVPFRYFSRKLLCFLRPAMTFIVSIPADSLRKFLTASRLSTLKPTCSNPGRSMAAPLKSLIFHQVACSGLAQLPKKDATFCSTRIASYEDDSLSRRSIFPLSEIPNTKGRRVLLIRDSISSRCCRIFIVISSRDLSALPVKIKAPIPACIMASR